MEVSKLYTVRASNSQNIGKTCRLELRGTVSIDIYGSENKPAALANMSKVNVDTLVDDSYYTLDTLPTYIAFVGTADVIEIGGYELIEDLGAIS